MENPFKPDIIVTGSSFIGRKEELNDLKHRMESSKGTRILLTAPRRYGKTSLLHNLINELNKKDHLCVYMDIFNCLSIDDLANTLIKQVAAAPGYSNLQKLSDWIDSNILSLRANLRFSINHQGEISAEPMLFKNEQAAFEKIETTLKDLNELAAKKQVTLIIDEFQSIVEWDKQQRFEKSLRTITQTLANLNIIFSGSQVKLLYDIFNSPQRPFFQQAQSFSLNPIDIKTLGKWIKSQFHKNKVNIEDKVIENIYQSCFSNPRHIQAICYELWNMNSSGVDIDFSSLEKTLDIMTQKKKTDFENLFLQLSLSQKSFLKALAEEESITSLYNKDFCAKHKLTASTIQKIIQGLEYRYLVTHSEGKYYISDPIFRRWLLK